VRQSDAHAWAEVWLAEVGWIRVDPTAAVAPERIERNLDAAIADDAFDAGLFLRRNPLFAVARQAWDAANNFWNNQVIEFDQASQLSLLERLGLKDASLRDLAISFGIVLVGAIVLLSAYLAWQIRPRRRDPLCVVYAYLCEKLAKADLGRHPHEGPRDYLCRAASARPEHAAALAEIRSLYIGLRYGPESLSTQLSRLKYLVNRLRLS
jgi:hypothetical protein